MGKCKQKMKVYGAKTLYPGNVIGVSEEHLVGVPDKRGFTSVVFQGEEMKLKGKKILGYRTFEDKFGRDKVYRLAYYKWSPEKEQVENTSLFEPTNTDHINRLLKIRDELKSQGKI